jgi:hypothetical protein
MTKKVVPKFKIVNKRNVKESNQRYFVTSCGVVCGEDNNSLSLEEAKARLNLYKKRGYNELLIINADDFKPTVVIDNTIYENITFNHIYVPKKHDRFNIDYINMVRFSDSSIGAKLSLGSPINLVNNLFGEIGTMKNFMDFITNPKYPKNLLKKKKISSEILATIPKCKSRTLPNYWGIIATILIERIKNDKVLVEELLSLPKTVKFTMFKLKTAEDIAGNKVNVITPMVENLRYCIIVQDIFNALKNNRKALNTPETLIEIIKKNTACKDKDLYDGLELVCK